MKKKRQNFLNRLSQLLFVLACVLLPLSLSAQDTHTVSGTITDNTGETIIGASVKVKGSTIGAITNIDGKFQLANVPDNATLVVSYVGFAAQEVAVAGKTVINITLREDLQKLEEVVVVGYGSMKKSDATGSVELLTAKDMNKGAIVTADNLITGRMPGVQVIPNGNPGTGSQIRIRGGASLDASNDPLIVVDGLPLENASISQINPNDIETFSVLKDASASAIYGSRASNGVIIITTKKGSGDKWTYNLDAQGSLNTLPWTVQSLSQSEFIERVTNISAASAAMLGYNGTIYDTDWQKEIFHNTASANANFSAMGKIAKILPARFSVGYNNTPGLLKTSGYQRTNASAILSPVFFNNTLKVDANFNGSYERYNKADEGAIGTAIFFDPTKPVYVNGSRDKDAKYLGYYEWGADYTANNNYPYNNLSGRNPVSLLNEVNHTSDVYKLWGNIQFDYALPFVKGLNAIVNLGLQTEKWNEDSETGKIAATIYNGQPVGAEWHNNGKSSNYLLDAYLKYNNSFDAFKLDLTGGYSYQKYNVGTEYNSKDVIKNGLDPTTELPLDKIYTEKVLISFFGRANLSYADKYLLTLTLRNDHSSMFSKENRSGWFPAASFAWRVLEEDFMQEQNVFSNLKLRLGWGITGQQNLYGDERININRYLPLYALGTNTASQYPIGGDGYPVYPLAYNPNLKWEETSTYNAGLDFGFADSKVYGTVDVYYKKSTDLLANVMLPAGVNFANQMFMNNGSFTTKGIELGLNWDVFRNRKQGAFNWTLAYNVSFNKLEITDYSKESSNEKTYVAGGGGGIPIAIFELGNAPYTYNVYKQVYDESGKPIEGVFEDLNNNQRLDEGDRYLFHSPNPDATMGLSTNLSYQNFDFSMAWRASIGNYIYNAIGAMNSYSTQLNPSGSYLHNVISTEYYTPDDTKRVSDRWIENGSFVKWDNVTLGYNFNKIVKHIDLRAYCSVQNILTITKANVHDPEIGVGGDLPGVIQNLYPRPRTFLLGVSVKF
ncbi:MAG: SusC/RagA family TonB-linked outer membrane protein [Paludibacter sp.]|jgi:iron complex outermembrane receptor protein|nr:SusC/RagA family TonB-linked outer membrane protein [Paludibacter sp.]